MHLKISDFSSQKYLWKYFSSLTNNILDTGKNHLLFNFLTSHCEEPDHLDKFVGNILITLHFLAVMVSIFIFKNARIKWSWIWNQPAWWPRRFLLFHHHPRQRRQKSSWNKSFLLEKWIAFMAHGCHLTQSHDWRSDIDWWTLNIIITNINHQNDPNTWLLLGGLRDLCNLWRG